MQQRKQYETVTLGKPEADMTQIQCCLLTFEVFEFVSVWLRSLIVDDHVSPPSYSHKNTMYNTVLESKLLTQQHTCITQLAK